MNENKCVDGDSVMIIVPYGKKKKKKKIPWKKILFLLAAIIFIVGIIFYALSRTSRPEPVAVEEVVPSYFEPEEMTVEKVDTVAVTDWLGETETLQSYVECIDTIINDISMQIFVPRNLHASLHLGPINYADTTIFYAAQAADIRQDNGKILGAFVLKGQPLSYGLSKRGFCSILGDTLTVGVADNTPLFEEATQHEGYFFRQYPLVGEGRIVESALKGKSVRRALCEARGHIFMASTLEAESFHDFSQALVDLGVRNAIYLVGGTAYGWSRNERGERQEWGQRNHRVPRNISYIVWRKK